MTKEEMLVKLQEIKTKTKEMIDNASLTGNATEDQE